MTVSEIVDRLGREKVVEQTVQNIAHVDRLTPELKDLSQMVYVILLSYEPAKILDLWEHGQIRYFISRIILNQYRSSKSPFHMLFRRFSGSSVPITDSDTAEQ